MRLLIIAFAAAAFSVMAKADNLLTDYDKWSVKISPVEFRGGNHKPGKSSDYFVKLEMVVSDKTDKTSEKLSTELIVAGPVSTTPLAWRPPTDEEQGQLTMEVQGEDFRKSLSLAMAKAAKPEDQFVVELKFTAFKKPWIPYFQKPEILGSTSIKPESYLQDSPPTSLDISLGLGGLLKFKLIPTGIAKK